MDEDERRRKVEAGRAKSSFNMPRSQSLASYRQKRAKGDTSGEAKKTQKRKGQTVSQIQSTTTQDAELNSKTNHEKRTETEKSEVHRLQNRQQGEQTVLSTQSPSQAADFKEEELVALTGKEQLKQLQEAVEKRNEIIARLSSNLQDALASRDQVQLEAQSLAGQIQALQRQLQQASVEFLRIKSHTSADVRSSLPQHQHGNSSSCTDITEKEAPAEGLKNFETEPLSGFQSNDNETDTTLQVLRAQLEEEKENTLRLSTELAQEIEKHRCALSLLEEERKGRDEERQERGAQLRHLQTQLDLVQTQCLEMQQFKAEKENLNREVLELRQKLQVKEDAERRLCEEVQASSEQIRRLKEELEEGPEGVRQLSDAREVEIVGLKDSKNRHNQAKADLGCDKDLNADNTNMESESDQNSINVPISGDVLMERYLSSALPEQAQSFTANSFEHSSPVDVSADNSFELNSEVLGDEPLLSISNRFPEGSDSLCDNLSLHGSFGVSEAISSNLQPIPQWHYSSISGEHDMSNLSEQQIEETDLEKELMNQQCRELREELDVKDRDLNVLREEVIQNVEELEEARSRWAQVTDELNETLRELEAEKEKRRLLEEQINTKAQEQDDLKNKLSALMEEKEKATEAMLLGQEAESSRRADEKQLHTQQTQCDFLILELEESKMSLTSTAALLGERTKELAEASKEIEYVRAQLLGVQTEMERLRVETEKRHDSLDEAEKEKRELESQIFCLKQNLTNLEEAQSHAVHEGAEHRRKEEEKDERIRKMEQFLEEELEQFESLLKAKDEEIMQEREKWEEERQEKDKELVEVRSRLKEQRSKWEEEVKALLEKQATSVEEVTNKLETSHKEEISKLQKRHQQEISHLNAHQESELLKLQAKMEEDQKKQISLIKQVTEREHESMVSELTAKHDDELVQLRTELRESMEAAHQAELEQAQIQKSTELEALRLSLADIHVSQIEHSTLNLEQEHQSALAKVQQSLKDKFNEEIAIIQARHQSEMDHTITQNQEQQQKLQELHKQMTNELKRQWETSVAQEKTAMEEKHANEIQALQLKGDKDAESAYSVLRASLFETQNNLSAAQSELANTQTSLSQKNRTLAETQATLLKIQTELKESLARLGDLQVSSEEQRRKLEEELKQALADRDAAASSLEELVSSNDVMLKEKEQQARHLEDKEKQLQEEVSRLQEEKKLLKQNSEDEMGQLWSQLESMRASRQELGELKEQLLARSSRVDDIERLKTEFNHQKQELKEQNEAEMENLRRYFEQRLRVAEETYREEITLLQLRLVESALEESVLKTADGSFLSQGQVEEERDHSLTEPDLTPREAKMEEKHLVDLSNLQSSMATSFKAELLQVRSDLTDHYYNELQELKTHHVLEQEQLRAKLSDRHLQEISRVRLEASRQVEVEVEQRMWYHTEELQTMTTILHSLENRLITINNDHEAEKQKHIQELKWEFAEELKKFQEQVQHQLNQAEQTIEEEKSMLEQALTQKYEISLTNQREKHQTELESERAALLYKHSQERDALNAKHKAQVESLSASHSAELAAAAVELKAKHSAELVALEVALGSTRQADLDTLKAGLQETNHAQLEAREAELARKHQEDMDELEKRLLDNLETVEATYLKEVQALHEQIGQLKEKQEQELNVQKSEQRQEMENYATEQLALREELRKELAQVHIEKFSAMAAELSQLHKSELTAQKEALDTDHCRALESLKKQVLELEKQHSAALLHLTQSCSTEKEELITQHHLQLQELRGVSARELEACRRELEEESSRQRQHFLEEVELLKVQSEERLQDRINQLKTAFEEEKQAELDNLRRSFTSEQEEKERSYTGKMSQLTAQLQQLDAVVAQLRSEVGCLQTDLSGKQAEMETLNILLQRRERESQEGGNLVKMLTEDLRTAKEESHKLGQANAKLRKVLIEMIRSTVATEELIGQKICSRAKSSEIYAINKVSQTSGILLADSSSDDPELTHMLCESLLISDTQITPGGEEASENACSRLHQAVDMLLELLNQANKQLEQTHDVHLSLEEKFSKGKEDSAHLFEQHKLLMEQLDQEAKLKAELQLKLHKAEGLVDGYMADKAALEESLQQKEAQEERLVEEFEDLKVKLHQSQILAAELESLRVKHQELDEEHSVLLRQKEHLSAGLGEREKALLAETERLAQDRIDLQRQAEKDTSLLSQRLKTLERELEEQETKGLETEQHHKSHTEDLSQQVLALEKQLKNNRQFIEEQAIEREHERDDFQQEIRRLESRLRQTAGVDGKGHKFEDLIQQVESLQAIIRDKTDGHAALLTANQQAQRDLEERNDEIDKLVGRIRELEQALLNSTESNRATLQLEQELHRVKLKEQELTQDKQALEQQQLSNRLQISALQSKLDETRHCYHDNTRDPTQELRDALDAAQQSLHSKEQEMESLQGHLETVQNDLSIKEVELKHLTLQLELLSNQNSDHVTELQEKIDVLTEKVAALSVQKNESETEADKDAPVEEMLAAALLQEKNLEIDHLSNEIQKLEQELESTENNKVLEAELEDLHSQVEHLKSEITRVREDRREEEERLHEVISTLQAELATLGPNLHEVSDSQDGDSINPSPAVSPEPNYCTSQEQQRHGEPNSLKQELNLTHSASIRSHQSRIKALQSQLDTAVAEKEALERLLLTQEKEYRGHGEELGNRLKAECEKAEELQGWLVLKEAELEDVKLQMEQEQERRKLSEEERDSFKMEMEEARALREKNEQLSFLVVELQNGKQGSLSEIRSLQTKCQEMKTEMDALREASVTLERQVQAERAEVGDMEELLAEERIKIQTLEAVKGELSAERNALRCREKQLQEEIERLRQEVASLGGRIQDLTVQLNEKETVQEEAHKEVLTHAEVTLAKADAALRAKEGELSTLKAKYQTLKAELTSMKQSLSSSRERSEKLETEGQTKDQALVDLESDNQRLNTELQSLQDDLAAQGEELSCQRRELQQLKQLYHQQEIPAHKQKDSFYGAFEDALSLSQSEDCLSSPEVLRRIECSEDRLAERFHVSAVGSQLSELSALNNTGVELAHYNKNSPRVVMEPPRSRTITPDPPSRTSHSPGSVSMSDNFSVLDSVDTDRVHELEDLDLTRPPSPLGSTSSLSAPEWASDGYGSNVSSELGARLRVELEQTERLDAQFVEYLRCRGINPTVNTDSAAGSMSYSEDLLSPELQGLLKKVYQESCRILTLSQRRPTMLSQPNAPDVKMVSSSQTQYHTGDGANLLDQSASNPPMSWQQEKRALQETVIALREMLCRMAQRQPPPDYKGEDVWSREQAESQLRAELEESQKQLKCAHNIQQEQKSKIQSLRLAVDGSEEALRKEHSRIQELQQLLEQERAVSVRKNREEEEKRGALQASTGQQKAEVMTLRGQVEQERVACSNLKQELQIEQSRSVLLEKRLEDTHKELQEERQCSALKLEHSLQEKTSLERLLSEAESRSAEKLRVAHRKLDEERDHRSRQVDELNRRHEKDAASDRQFICDLRTQLEQERRQGQDLASTIDKLRTELLQSKRNWEEDDRLRREELQKLQEAVVRQRAAVEALKEQKQEAGHALELERERARHQATELAELKERVRLMKDKQVEREEQWHRERTKVCQEQVDREKRQERTNNKLCELESLRRQDQQRLQELQRTLAELQREEKEMAAQRLSGQMEKQQSEAQSSHQRQGSGTPKHLQRLPSPDALESLLKENSELTAHVTSLSQEKASLKHTLTGLERQLRRTECELAKVSTDCENRPISDLTTNSKVQRLYERYLRAESFRKALVYQKRYLLLVLGGFQECEQATLCLIANMGVRTSPPLSSQRSPLARFRAAVRVAIAVSRMRFLTRKWQRAIRRLSLSGPVNGHPTGNKVEVLRQQQPRIIVDSPPNRDAMAALVPPTKSPFRLHNRSYSGASLAPAGPSHDPEPSLTDYIHHLEKVQQRLVGPWQVSKTHLAPPPKEERRIQSACSPDMIGYRQRWLQENRTWLYLSCLSPLYLYGPGSSVLRDPKLFDH